MYNFIKPKSISEKKLNSYISIIGLSACKVFSLLFEENISDFKTFQKKFNIQKFELESYLNMLQAAKLIQVSVIEETLKYQMFKPLLLIGNENQKWKQIQKHQVKVDFGSNISKTYFDIFNKSSFNEKTQNSTWSSWVMFFEKLKKAKITVAELIFINQIQFNYNLGNDIVNIGIEKTFQKCKKWNPKYFELVIKTFRKLNIDTIQKSQAFFAGNFFAEDSNSEKYMLALEKELEIMENEDA